MTPKTREQLPESPPLEPPDEPIRLVITPLTDIGSPLTVSEVNSATDSSGSEPESAPEIIQVTPEVQERNRIPLEQNLRELLARTANTDSLETVTQIKLRVIAREVTLQHLGVYLPSLRELNLDGSVISSLRDLGSCLRNLRILKVNRCQLSCIDGVFGFENLEELHAANNCISDLSSCAFLMSIRVLDVRSNIVKDLDALGFLALCTALEHLQMEGNEVDQFAEYRQTIKNLLPSLKTLDSLPFEELISEYASDTQSNGDSQLNSTEVQSRSAGRGRFTFRFPPRVFSNSVLSPEDREE